MQSGGISQYPADQLIPELLATERPASATEVQQVLNRMAAVPFDQRVLPVPVKLRGASYLGGTLGAREPALLSHLAQRVIEDEQWVDGTTEAEWLADLRKAVRDPTARLAIYPRHGGTLAATLTATHRVVPRHRRGEDALPWLFVVYPTVV